MKLRRLAVVTMTAALALVGFPGFAGAADESFPTRTVTIVSPFAPGSGPDVSARLVASLLADQWGKPVVVENKVGANGNIGMTYAARSTPDGYTLVMAPDTTFCVNPSLYSNMGLDPRREFAPVASVISDSLVLLANTKIPANTLPEFVEYARKQNPPLLYSSISVGSLHHLAMEMLKRRGNFEISHVPYRGGTASLSAAMSGEVQVVFSGAASAGMVASGRLKALALTGSHRSKGFPSIPVIGEFYPGYAVDPWMGLFAPAQTPAPLMTKLRRDVRQVLKSDTFLNRINVSGNLEPLDLDIEAFKAFIDQDCVKYDAFIKSAGIHID